MTKANYVIRKTDGELLGDNGTSLSFETSDEAHSYILLMGMDSTVLTVEQGGDR